MQKAKVVTQQLRYKRKDGSIIDVELFCSPLIAKGVAQGAIEIFRDVTEQQRIEHSKSEFVSLASHQLRTPISAISWFGEMLLNNDAGKLSEEQSDYISQIYASNRRSAAIVDAMLLASDLELSNLQANPQLVDLEALCRGIIKEQLARLPINKKLDIKQAYDPRQNKVHIDPQFAAALVGAVIINAIKYTPSRGTVSIHVTADSKTAGQEQRNTYITVADSGYGIPQAEQKHVFEKLFRASNVKEKDTDGTGLGLYIAKLIADQVGGHIVFSSEEHKGTRFTITLPIKQAVHQSGEQHV